MKLKGSLLANQNIMIGFIVFVGLFLSFILKDYRILYVMILALFVDALVRDNNRTKNLWKYVVSAIALCLLLFLLFNWI